jgi:hypothetical protein
MKLNLSLDEEKQILQFLEGPDSLINPPRDVIGGLMVLISARMREKAVNRRTIVNGYQTDDLNELERAKAERRIGFGLIYGDFQRYLNGKKKIIKLNGAYQIK